MTADKAANGKIWVLTPLFGSLLFITLYIVATILYPGGSQEDKHARGFSWLHNYWCNLLNQTGINGEPNRGESVAIIALFVLAITVSSFCLIYGEVSMFEKGRKRIIQLSGICSVVPLAFLATSFHDVVINISGGFAIIAMAGVYIGIYKKGWYKLFAFGIFNLLLIAVNNYVYYLAATLYYLPIIQKVTFLFYLLWICMVTVKLYRQPLVTNQRASIQQ